MANQPDLPNLLADLSQSGDPVEGNPFPAGGLQHKVWNDATRRAEEELCRFNSDVLKTRADSPDAAVSWMCRLVVGKFDIWAKRGIHVVWSDGAVRAYDQWLINYAGAWLNHVRDAKPFSPVVPPDCLFSELRLCLMERIEFWKAEARRYMAEQRKHAQENVEIPEAKASVPSVAANDYSNIGGPPGPAPAQPSSAAATNEGGSGSRKGYRAEVRQWMKRKHLCNLAAASKRLGVSTSTLKSIMSDKGKRRYGNRALEAVLMKIGHNKA